MDLEVCKRESEALCPNIGAVREPGVLLFRFSPEPQPAEHRLQLVPQVPMAACPRAAVAGTRMRVIPFRIEPTAPRPAPSRTTSAAGTPLGLERHPEPEPNQGCVLPVEEGEAVLRRGNGEPHSRPSAGAILQSHPVRWGGGALEPETTFPVNCSGEDSLLLGEPPGLCARGLPVDGVRSRASGEDPPLRSGNIHSGIELE